MFVNGEASSSWRHAEAGCRRIEALDKKLRMSRDLESHLRVGLEEMKRIVR
jgi:hypothetical protein